MLRLAQIIPEHGSMLVMLRVMSPEHDRLNLRHIKYGSSPPLFFSSKDMTPPHFSSSSNHHIPPGYDPSLFLLKAR